MPAGRGAGSPVLSHRIDPGGLLPDFSNQRSRSEKKKRGLLVVVSKEALAGKSGKVIPPSWNAKTARSVRSLPGRFATGPVLLCISGIVPPFAEMYPHPRRIPTSLPERDSFSSIYYF
jgi:hypothetical protein